MARLSLHVDPIATQQARRSVLRCLLMIATAAGCSSQPGTGQQDLASSRDAGRDAASGCPVGKGYGGGEASIQVSAVSATVVDTAGAPISGALVQLCGLNLCKTGTTSAAGTVAVSFNALLKRPMFRFGDALNTVELAAPITMAATTFPKLVTALLPKAGAAFTPGGDAVSGGVTLTLAKGGVATVDMLNYDTTDKQLFRAVQIPVDNHQEDPVPGIATYGLTAVYGVAPLETTFCPAAKITVPNSLAWSAGKAVEFWVLGVDVLQQWSPYGDWVKISDGQVSADGSTISTADGQGFGVLETFGIRPKP